jgi:hypothetical protein
MKNQVRVFQIGTVAAVLGIVIFAFQNCAPATSGSLPVTPPNAAEKVSSDEISQRYGEIHALVANSLSCQTDADCAAIATGSKICGGPTEYLSVAKTSSGYSHIGELASALKTRQQEFNRQNSGSVGVCSIVVEPSVACVASTCQAQ